MILKTVLTFFLMAPCFASANTVSNEFRRFVKNPTSRGLKAVQRACRKGVLSADLIDGNLKELESRSSIYAIRALVTVRQHCSDGALSEDLNGILGVEVLLEHPQFFIEALTQEKVEDSLIGDFAYSDGESGEGEFIDCDKSCLPKINDFYDKKAAAIRSVKLSKPGDKQVQEILLSHIANAKNKWIERLSK